MSDHADLLSRLEHDPRYRALVARRTRFAALLTAILIVTYFGFILFVAFGREVLAQPIGDGATSVGIPIGLGVILVAIGLTWVYVGRANGAWDAEMASILADARGEDAA